MNVGLSTGLYTVPNFIYVHNHSSLCLTADRQASFNFNNFANVSPVPLLLCLRRLLYAKKFRVTILLLLALALALAVSDRAGRAVRVHVPVSCCSLSNNVSITIPRLPTQSSSRLVSLSSLAQHRQAHTATHMQRYQSAALSLIDLVAYAFFTGA
ncbi:unnamed protein product [Protopolystoma xenopodis]|uniref:Uncharacterized protein n=1 Tax=Protopolystoma xenopodis TaxID=117903 RepID=A0A448X660_9PLAT|nr:unnamed protein product [Protopolystoma xenopodis]